MCKRDRGRARSTRWKGFSFFIKASTLLLLDLCAKILRYLVWPVCPPPPPSPGSCAYRREQAAIYQRIFHSHIRPLALAGFARISIFPQPRLLRAIPSALISPGQGERRWENALLHHIPEATSNSRLLLEWSGGNITIIVITAVPGKTAGKEASCSMARWGWAIDRTWVLVVPGGFSCKIFIHLFCAVWFELASKHWTQHSNISPVPVPNGSAHWPLRWGHSGRTGEPHAGNKWLRGSVQFLKPQFVIDVLTRAEFFGHRTSRSLQWWKVREWKINGLSNDGKWK